MCSRTRRVSGTRPTCIMAPTRTWVSMLAGSPPKTVSRPEFGRARAQQQADRRGLAGAIRPEQCHQFTGSDLEVEIRQRAHLAVTLVHAFELRHRMVAQLGSAWCVLAESLERLPLRHHP